MPYFRVTVETRCLPSAPRTVPAVALLHALTFRTFMGVPCNRTTPQIFLYSMIPKKKNIVVLALSV